MIAGLFVLYGKEFVKLYNKLVKLGEVLEAQSHIDAMIQAVKDHGWMASGTCALDYYGKNRQQRKRRRQNLYRKP